MKTVFLSGTIALSVLSQWPLLFADDGKYQTQMFTAAPPVSIQILDE